MAKANELIITRIFDAPRELVWRAWTDPEMVKKWWGPKDFTAPSIKIDFKVGGKYLYCMRGPAGSDFDKDFWSAGTFKEIVPMEKIVVTDHFSDENGNKVDPTTYGMSKDLPKEMDVTVTFEEYPQAGAGKTKFTIAYARPQSDAAYEAMLKSGMEQGWNQSFDKLEQALKGGDQQVAKNKTKITAEPGKQEILITREFDVPRELVFKAHTDPKLYVKWLGPRELTMTLEKFEPKNGGSWRYIHKEKDGNEYAFHGVVHEITAPERIIQTFEFEGLPEKGHVALETARFEELPGNRTRVTSQSVFQSVADRDGMVQSGMERGVNDSYERLDELLAKS